MAQVNILHAEEYLGNDVINDKWGRDICVVFDTNYTTQIILAPKMLDFIRRLASDSDMPVRYRAEALIILKLILDGYRGEAPDYVKLYTGRSINEKTKTD